MVLGNDRIESNPVFIKFQACKIGMGFFFPQKTCRLHIRNAFANWF